jgi:hypothetical protein
VQNRHPQRSLNPQYVFHTKNAFFALMNSAASTAPKAKPFGCARMNDLNIIDEDEYLML